MPIPDLLWACPVCGEDRSLEPEGRGGWRCRACGTVYERGRGADIAARRPDGTRTVRRPTEWLALLPTPQAVVRDTDRTSDIIRRAKVAARWVVGWEEVRDRHGYLNRIEVWGDPSHGELVLRPREMVYASGEGAEPARWPLGSIAAVQASSSALQVKGKRLPLVELSFENDSIYLWERLLHVALRDFYGRTGRGEIAEFQPRIVTA